MEAAFATIMGKAPQQLRGSQAITDLFAGLQQRSAAATGGGGGGSGGGAAAFHSEMLEKRVLEILGLIAGEVERLQGQWRAKELPKLEAAKRRIWDR